MSLRSVTLAGAVFAVLPMAAGCTDRSATENTGPKVDTSNVAAIQGPSVLKALGLTVDDIRFGQLGGSEPPPPSARQEPMPPVAPARGFVRGMFSRFFGWRRNAGVVAQPFVIAGADLYRINCQSCHGPDGSGSPPDVNSLVGPVEGTSADLLVQRMRDKSRPVDVPFLQDVAAGAEGDLRQRLREGGDKMPAFTYLGDDEVEALMGYLKRMTEIPEAPASDRLLTLSAARVGEHVVRGTCHTCHDATGPGRHGMMMNASSPSLASMPEEQAFDDLVAKVREGVAPPMMMMSPGPSKMPKLSYLTPEELGAALVYLTRYAPRD